MALGERKRSTFVSVRKGKFCVWDGNENKEFGFVSGRLTKIDFNTMPQTANQKYPNYEDIRLHMQDGDECYIVTCTAKTSAGRSLMKQLPSIDPDVDITLELGYEEEFKSTTVFVKQHGVATKWFWSEAAGYKDLPPAVKYIDPADGAEKTQYNDQVAYLKQYTLTNVLPKLSEPVAQQEVPDFDSMDEDDAPF